MGNIYVSSKPLKLNGRQGKCFDVAFVLVIVTLGFKGTTYLLWKYSSLLKIETVVRVLIEFSNHRNDISYASPERSFLPPRNSTGLESNFFTKMLPLKKKMNCEVGGKPDTR